MQHHFGFWENFFKLDLFSFNKPQKHRFFTLLGHLATLVNNTICLFASHCELTNVVAAPVLEVLLCCFVSAVAACRFTCMCFAGDNTAPSIIIALCADSSSLFNTHSAPNFPASSQKEQTLASIARPTLPLEQLSGASSACSSAATAAGSVVAVIN
jgi:hypothetical protein